jgi:hypothetical protein
VGLAWIRPTATVRSIASGDGRPQDPWCRLHRHSFQWLDCGRSILPGTAWAGSKERTASASGGTAISAGEFMPDPDASSCSLELGLLPAKASDSSTLLAFHRVQNSAASS